MGKKKDRLLKKAEQDTQVPWHLVDADPLRFLIAPEVRWQRSGSPCRCCCHITLMLPASHGCLPRICTGRHVSHLYTYMIIYDADTLLLFVRILTAFSQSTGNSSLQCSRQHRNEVHCSKACAAFQQLSTGSSSDSRDQAL